MSCYPCIQELTLRAWDEEEGGTDETNGYVTVGHTRPDGTQLGTVGAKNICVVSFARL